jgi:uncharacterized delta-60 repeat protein
MKLVIHLCLACLGVLFSFNTFSQKVSTSYPARLKERAAIYCMDMDGQGNLILGGNFQFYKNEQTGSLIKVSGTERVKGPAYEIAIKDGYVTAVKALPDGKTLAVVNAFEPGSRIVRFNADGTLDPTFTPVSEYGITDFKFQSDGKIIVNGYFNNFKEAGYNGIVRLNTNGTIDNTFTKPQVSDGNMQRIVVVDKNDNIFYTDIGKIVKISAAGTLTDFASSNFQMAHFYEMAADEEGRLMISGDYDNNYRAYRINADGSIDNSFNSTILAGSVYDILARQNGDILVSGHFFIDGRNMFLIELNPDGTLKKNYDLTYGNNLKLFQDGSGDTFAFGDASINFERSKSIIKISDSGISEVAVPIYALNYALNYTVASAVQPDGKLVLSGTGGNFSIDDLHGDILRLNSDGTADKSFQSILLNELARQITVQDDGKLLAVTNNERFVRLLPDGGADLSFSTGLGFKTIYLNDNYSIGYVQAARFKNSKIFVSGVFNTYNGEKHNNIVILDLNGKAIGPEKNLPFETFSVIDMAVRSDGKMILSGKFKFEGKDQEYTIIQLNADGSLDEGLLVKPNPYYITDIEVDGKDRLLIAGQFSNFLGSGYNNLVRFNSDGTVDNTFNVTSLNYNNSALIKCIANDGIAITGVQSYKNVDVPGFAVIDNKGDLIPLQNNIDITSRVYDLAYGNNILYAIGKIVAGNGETISGAAKIVFPIEDPVIADLDIEVKSDSSATLSWDTEMIGAEKFVISQSTTGLNYVPIDTVSAGVRTYDATGLQELTTYYFNVYGMNETENTDAADAIGTTEIKIPKALPATDVTASSFVANWDEIGKTENYVLQVSADNFSTFVSGYENRETTAVSASVNDLKPGLYTFRVKRKRDGIFSDFSAPIEVSTLMMVSVEGDKNSETAFYPNPVRDKLVVRAPAGTQFEIVGLNGTVIKTNATIQNELPVLDIADLPKGLYLLRIASKHGVNSYKLIKD